MLRPPPPEGGCPEYTRFLRKIKAPMIGKVPGRHYTALWKGPSRRNPQGDKEIVMPAKRLKEFLDGHQVKYVAMMHSPAYTAQQIAASAHVPGKELAKTVIVRIDGKMAMAVLPASFKVNFERLRAAAGPERVELASEKEFQDAFPGCEVGAMPPFGNLYGMEVYASQALAEDEEIAFNAGSHTELIRLSYKDFEELASPRVAKISYGD